MSSGDPGIDARFEWLRRAHRSERAPDALRRRALERARSMPSRLRRRSPRAWLGRGGLWGLAAGVAASIWLGVQLLAVDGAELLPSAEPAPQPSLRHCAQPLPSSPWDPREVALGAAFSGFEGEVLETETDCGPLTRRYLVRVPVDDAASAPVLIVLHDAGESAEQVELTTRWWFLDLAQRERVVLVYANASPSLLRGEQTVVNAGVWQTDEGAHPAVDDSAYLRGIVDQLRLKRGLAQRGEVFLAGYGSGAFLALAAALRHPDRYAGVAAFLPQRLPRSEDLDGSLRSAPGPSQLRSVFVVLPDSAQEDPSALAVRWASALGSEPGSVRVTQRKSGIQRVDSTLASGVALGLLRLSPQVDPFPPPGGADPIVRRASEARPFFLDGPGAAWAFFRQPRPAASRP